MREQPWNSYLIPPQGCSPSQAVQLQLPTLRGEMSPKSTRTQYIPLVVKQERKCEGETIYK